MRDLPPLLIGMLLAGCGTASERPDSAATGWDAALDAGPPDADTADAGRPDAGPGLPITCEGPCRSLTVAATLNQAQGGFQRAYYGLTAPGQSSTGDWALYVEASSGGADGCPTETSPTPDWNLIVAAVPPLALAPVTTGSASLFDFVGHFLDAAPLTRASAVSVQLVAADVCTECVGRPAPAHPDGFVAFDLEARFPEGAVMGHVFATHCDSLDVAD